ncbi:MAG: hypothetical protein ACU0BF_01750 [Paracoccaceae bacterium]
MTDHPCFHCPLPDCDETDVACELRRVLRDRSSRLRGNRISRPLEVQRRLETPAYRELYEDARRAREGRPTRDVVAAAERIERRASRPA